MKNDPKIIRKNNHYTSGTLVIHGWVIDMTVIKTVFTGLFHYKPNSLPDTCIMKQRKNFHNETFLIIDRIYNFNYLNWTQGKTKH